MGFVIIVQVAHPPTGETSFLEVLLAKSFCFPPWYWGRGWGLICKLDQVGAFVWNSEFCGRCKGKSQQLENVYFNSKFLGWGIGTFQQF